MKDNEYIHFDWAIKNILRDKANFSIMEGFLSVLLNREIKILELLESESNQQSATDKLNGVEMMVKADNEELFIVEVQNMRYLNYMQRILYGTSKAITEHISIGESYKKVKKIYSINIFYIDIGRGDDFIYHGTKTFRGMFLNDVLKLKKREHNALGEDKLKINANVFPEYYIIRLPHFKKDATTHTEEWISFLKNGNIKEKTNAPGLPEAKEKLRVASMSDKDRDAYFDHLETIMYQNDTIESYRKEGLEEGRAICEAIGLEKEIKELAKDMKKKE